MFKNKNYVLEVYKKGSFSRAAESLYVSQPSLSASIKRIEDKIKTPIFDRSTNPISLTEVGKEYVKYALEIDGKERDFEMYVLDSKNLLAGTIRLGGTSLFSSFMLPKIISNFKQKHPNINFEVVEDNTKNLMQKLSHGDIDIVIDNAKIASDDITASHYTEETILLAVPKNFEINDKLVSCVLSTDDVKNDKHLEGAKSVSIVEFKDLPFILLNPENDTGKRALKIFNKHGITPNVVFNLDQQVTAFNLSGTGIGISFISDTLIKNISHNSTFNYFKLKDKETLRNVYFYKKTNRYLSHACQEFIKQSLEN